LLRDEHIAEVVSGRCATHEELQLFHVPAYLEALQTGKPNDLASSGFTWFPEMYDVSRSRVGCILDAVDTAVAAGISGALDGGGHHARPYSGGALSSINCVGVGVHYARRFCRRVIVLDLDLHFGNGTTAGFPDDLELFLFDYHGHASDFFHPTTPHLFRNLAAEPEGGTYLSRLREDLPQVLDAFEPELCLYVGGMDVFAGTPNAHLRLSTDDIRAREGFVFSQMAERKIPVVYTLGGGYAANETVARHHLLTACAAADALRLYTGREGPFPDRR
jgi:acetoin utilization deacetylase AcuC-like enzyme